MKAKAILENDESEEDVEEDTQDEINSEPEDCIIVDVN